MDQKNDGSIILKENVNPVFYLFCSTLSDEVLYFVTVSLHR